MRSLQRSRTSPRPEDRWTEKRELASGGGALGDDGLAFDGDDAFLEELGEDAGGVEALEAADRVEIFEADGAVDLREDETGARVEVQPDDLVRRQDDAGDPIHRAELALAHLDEVLLAGGVKLLRFRVLRVAREDLRQKFHRAGEVVQRDQLSC